MINARAEYVELVTEYQIENFWQLSGLTAPGVSPLNENVVAPKETDENKTELDPMVQAVKNKMLSYNG